MILHAASIAVFFVDQLAQAPVQVQCVQQSMPESWLKSLLPTIIQTVISLTSIIAAVCIAVASFRANKKTEHEQWIRDQKKAEWKELFGKAAEVHGVFLRAESPNPIHSMKTLMEELPSARLGLKECWFRCLFVADVLNTIENRDIYLAFDKKFDDGERDIRASNIARHASVPTTEQISDNYIGDNALFDQERATYNNLKDADNSFIRWILSVAKDDLC
jgi:hypothetical protein